jgi:hypothetical protein
VFNPSRAELHDVDGSTLPDWIRPSLREGLIEAERLSPSGPSQPGKGGQTPASEAHCTPFLVKFVYFVFFYPL